MAEPDWLKKMAAKEYLTENFAASGKSRYTISGVASKDPEWLEKAAAKTHAASGDDYVKLDSGLLTVNQINWMLRNTI